MRLAILMLTAAVCWGQTARGPSRIRYSRLGNHWAIPAHGLKIAYQFDEGSGTTLTDHSGAGNTATFPGGTADPTWTAQGLSYDGGDYTNVAFPSSWTGTSPATLLVAASSAWVGATRYFTSVGSASTGRLDSVVTVASKLYWDNWGGNNLAGTTNLSNNVWFSGGIARSASVATLFLNGKQDAQKSISGMNLSESSLTTGGRNSFGTMAGSIGLEHGWQVELTPARMAATHRVYRRIMAGRGVTLP